MTDQESLRKIEQSFKEQVDEVFTKDLEKSNRWSNWAGDLGFPCDSYHALVRLKGDLRPNFTIDLLKIFRPGEVWEEPNYRLIKDAGIKIVNRIGNFKWEKYQIGGKLDFRIAIPDPANIKNELIIPLEHKTCSPNVFRSIQQHKRDRTPLTQSRYHWIRKYPGQLTCYELMDESEYGMYFFFEKVSGDYLFWLVPLDLEYGEELIQRAERANENIAANKIPKPVHTELCNDCDFAMTYCFPDKDFGPGFQIVDHEETELKIKRYKELEKDYKEFRSLEKDLIGKKADPGILYSKNLIIGDYKITSKKVPHVFYPVPKEMKESFRQESHYFKTTIEELPKGKNNGE